MKAGANSTDKRHIRQLCEGGMSVEDVSLKLRLKLSVVKAFAPKPKAAPKAEPKKSTSASKLADAVA